MMDRAKIEDQAAFWLARRQDGEWSTAEESELAEWLAQSEAHKAAFWRLEYVSLKLDAYADSISLSAIPSGSRLTEQSEDHDLGANALPASWSFKALIRPVMIAASFAIILLGGNYVIGKLQTPAEVTEYATKFGQIGTVQLADGSKVELNTDTDVKFSQSRGSRNMWLERGEVYLDVAKDQNRPFVAHLGMRDVTVLGTRFAIFREARTATISVVEGRVRLDAVDQKQSAPMVLRAGDIATLEGDTVRVTANAIDQIRGNLAWRQGMVYFDDASLLEVAAKFNRYNTRRLIVSGPDVAEIRIGGSFRLDKVEDFSALLERAYGLRATLTENEIIISSN